MHLKAFWSQLLRQSRKSRPITPKVQKFANTKMITADENEAECTTAARSLVAEEILATQSDCCFK